LRSKARLPVLGEAVKRSKNVAKLEEQIFTKTPNVVSRRPGHHGIVWLLCLQRCHLVVQVAVQENHAKHRSALPFFVLRSPLLPLLRSRLAARSATSRTTRARRRANAGRSSALAASASKATAQTPRNAQPTPTAHKAAAAAAFARSARVKAQSVEGLVMPARLKSEKNSSTRAPTRPACLLIRPASPKSNLAIPYPPFLDLHFPKERGTLL